MNAYQFFLKHAGYSYDPKAETVMQGRIRCARALAKDEREARNGGFTYAWSIDEISTSAEFDNDDFNGSNSDPWQLWQCVMLNEEGRIVNSLHGIDFGRDGSPYGDSYRRVVEAELAGEGMTNGPQGAYRA